MPSFSRQIHMHLNGRMDGTYVKGCSIHKSFNRAVNIHDTHNVLIQNNVVFDVMGGAIFLEDGVETGGHLKINLDKIMNYYILYKIATNCLN